MKVDNNRHNILKYLGLSQFDAFSLSFQLLKSDFTLINFYKNSLKNAQNILQVSNWLPFSGLSFFVFSLLPFVCGVRKRYQSIVRRK